LLGALLASALEVVLLVFFIGGNWETARSTIGVRDLSIASAAPERGADLYNLPGAGASGRERSQGGGWRAGGPCGLPGIGCRAWLPAAAPVGDQLVGLPFLGVAMAWH